MRKGTLRVVAGSAGGLRLESPRGTSTRPTTERVREAVFASLGSATSGAAVLDLFAGSGAMAVEAMSRGARCAVLVERDRRAAEVCRRNISHTGFGAAARVVEADVGRYLGRPLPPEAPFDLVCCDPPYDLGDAELAGILGRLGEGGWLHAGAFVVVERPAGSSLVAPPGWRHRFSRPYGDTLVHLLCTSDDPSDDP
jgi:16S rRNA (guanine966-N2)-methyltransferase